MLTAGSPVQIFFFLLCDKTSLPGCYFAKSRDAAINRYLILIDERVNDPSKEEKKIEERKPRCYMPGHRVTHLPNRWGKKIDEARKRKRVKSVWWTGPTREGEWWGKIPWARFYNFFSLSLFSTRGPCKLFPRAQSRLSRSLCTCGKRNERNRIRLRRYRRKEKTHRS